MAIAFGGNLIWGTPLLAGRTLTRDEVFAIPAIYAETTGTGGVNRMDVERYEQGVCNVM